MSLLNFLLAAGFLIFAQSANAEALGWIDVIRRVQENNLELIAAEEAYKATVELESAARSGYFPKVSVSVNETQSAGSSLAFGQSYGAQLNFSQNLFSGFADHYKILASEKNSLIAKVNYRQIRISKSAEVVQAYEGLVFSKKMRQLVQSIIERRRNNLRNVQLRFQVGRENKGSVLLSESYVEQANFEDLQVIHDLELAQGQLKRAMGLSLDPVVKIELVDDYFSEPQKAEFSAAQFENLISEHPEVLTAQAQEDLNRSIYKSGQAQFYPFLDLVGSYGYFENRFFPEPYRWTLGLTLTIPLFDGGKDYATVKSSFLKVSAAQNQLKDKKIQVGLKLRQALFDYVEAVQKEKVDRSFLAAVSVREQVAESKYKNGLLSFDEWDLIEGDLIQRQKAVLSSQRDRIIKYSLWQVAQGVGVFNEKK